MAAVAITTARNPRLGPGGERATGAERLRGLREVWQVVTLFTVVLGGMYLGWFAPTEAAGVGAFGTAALLYAGAAAV